MDIIPEPKFKSATYALGGNVFIILSNLTESSLNLYKRFFDLF